MKVGDRFKYINCWNPENEYVITAKQKDRFYYILDNPSSDSHGTVFSSDLGLVKRVELTQGDDLWI